MKTTIASVALLSLMAVSSIEARPSLYLKSQAPRVWDDPVQENLDEYLQGARGFYYGFQMGLYKLDRVDESCLNKEAETKIVSIFGMIISGKLDLNKMMNLVADFMVIFQGLASCNVNAITDLKQFCFSGSKNTCTPDKIFENVQKNLFLIMAKFTDMSNIVMGGLPKDADTAYQFGKQVGLDFGSLVRVVLGFHQ